ncbi:glycosyltransferase family 2 protein [Robertmurraya sp. 2P01SA]|uniref:glycosyltransferase family 2 protein n=1 Tax=Robertmurraya sp. 2P01SA TaxID=3132300 RepID=UPI0039A5692B
MEDLISVIVPVYNSEKYLPKCIESILNQSYPHFELILIDDGSLDGSLHICQKYAEKNQRIRIFYQENRGPSAAMNKGLDMAEGNYIAFVDCDDYVNHQLYEILYKNLHHYKADISVSSFQYVYEEEEINDHLAAKRIGNEHIEIYEEREILETLYGDLHVENIVVWNKLYKREIFNGLRFKTGKWHEDEFIVHRILDRASKVVYSNLPLYFYMQRKSSFMGKKFNLTRLDFLEALEERMLFFQERGFQRLYNQTLDDYLNMLPKHYFLVRKFFPKEVWILQGLQEKYRRLSEHLHDLPMNVKIKYSLFKYNPLLYKVCMNTWQRMKTQKIGVGNKSTNTMLISPFLFSELNMFLVL